MTPETVVVSEATAPVIRDLLDEVEAIRAGARSLVAGLRPEQLAWRPAPGRWSIADCLEHLTRTADVTFALADPVIASDRARAVRTSKPYRPGWFERWMLSGMEPPPKKRFRVTESLAPAADRDPEEAVARFLTTQDRIAERIRASSRLDLAAVKVPSPVLRWLRYRLGFALQFTLAHERRHLWQARRVKDDPNFPE